MKIVPATIALLLPASLIVSCGHKLSNSQRPVSLYPPLDTIIPTHTSEIMRIDMNKLMANDAGALPDELTTDGIHLTKEGYEKWTGFLKKILDGNK
jgi:hypothetical protein